MPSLMAASATRQPILPRPTMPSVWPASSWPAKAFLPSSTLRSMSGVGGVERGHEAQRGRQVARRQQHAGQHQFLHCIGVRARRVEHRHAALAQHRHRDVVGAGAGAADGHHAGRDVHRCACRPSAAARHRAPSGPCLRCSGRLAGASGRWPRSGSAPAPSGVLNHSWPRIPSCRRRGPAHLRPAWRCRSMRACRPPSGGPSAAASGVAAHP